MAVAGPGTTQRGHSYLAALGIESENSQSNGVFHCTRGKKTPPTRKSAIERPLNSEFQVGNSGKVYQAQVLRYKLDVRAIWRHI